MKGITEAEWKALVPELELQITIIKGELARATKKFPRFQSGHEGYAVILEELDELWDEVKADKLQAARREAVQVAAMAIRFLLDVKP